MKGQTETNYVPTEVKGIYELIQRKLGMIPNNSLTKHTYEDMRINEDRYSPKYIVRLLAEKYPTGRAFFYFKSKKDYITLSSNGHLNVRDSEEDMFRAWGSSEFRSFKPRSVFEQLEGELIEIVFVPASNVESSSFDSYRGFIDWLDSRSDTN